MSKTIHERMDAVENRVEEVFQKIEQVLQHNSKKAESDSADSVKYEPAVSESDSQSQS